MAVQPVYQLLRKSFLRNKNPVNKLSSLSLQSFRALHVSPLTKIFVCFLVPLFLSWQLLFRLMAEIACQHFGSRLEGLRLKERKMVGWCTSLSISIMAKVFSDGSHSLLIRGGFLRQVWFLAELGWELSWRGEGLFWCFSSASARSSCSRKAWTFDRQAYAKYR